MKSGFKNLASFKQLRATTGGGNNKFALLFAYTSDMKWEDIVAAIKENSTEFSKSEYPNAIFILDRGYFIFAENEGRGAITNVDIEAIQDVSLQGYPDREQLSLYNFQNVLLELSRSAHVMTSNLSSYFRLPLITDEASYRFTLGSFAEFGCCEKHGDFSRKISSENLDKIVKWCSTVEPINWVKATHIAYNLPEDEEAYKRQPERVYIYNPDNLPLSEILTYPINDNDNAIQTSSLAFDMIETNQMPIWIPYYYSIKEGLISDCIKCEKSK